MAGEPSASTVGGVADVKNQRVRDDGFPAIRSLSISFSEN